MERGDEFHKNLTTQEDTLATMRSQQGFYKDAGELYVTIFVKFILTFICPVRTPPTTAPQPPGASSASTLPKQKRSPGSKSKPRQGSVDQQPSRQSKTPQPVAIALSDSEDEADKRGQKHREPPHVDLNFDSDVEEEVFKPPMVVISPVKEVFEVEEFPEYVAKAREGAARKVFGRLDPTQSNARSDSISSSESNTKLEITSNAHLISMPRPAPDPVVQILVSSQIEGTKPLLIRRKLSQRLKDVKYAWCDKQVLDGQPVSEEIKRLIFLTWRGNKVFDVTTCKALGLTADASGRLLIDGEGFDEEGRIHLEAWTEELFHDFKKQKAAQRKRLVLDPMEEEEEDESSAAKINPQENQKFKIILKAKDRTEFKIQVISSTAISKMIGAYRKEHKIADGVNISLYLDGDKLDPNSVVADADLDELTTIDVHVG
jgi:hypothetical protein